MSGPLSALSGILQGAVDWTFSAATLAPIGGAVTMTGSGGVTRAAAAGTPCRAKVDLKQSTLPTGGVVVITRIIILADSVATAPVEGNTITFDDTGKSYKLGAGRRDGIASHYVFEVVDNG